MIDDDPLARDLMESTLLRIGAVATCLPGGRQALQHLQLGNTPQPDASILDLMMPDFDGFATQHALRQLPRWQHTPVFIWTSMVLTDAEYTSLMQSASAIVAKGGGALADLVQALRRWRPVVGQTATHAAPDMGEA